MLNKRSLILRRTANVMFLWVALLWSHILFAQSPILAFSYSNNDSIDNNRFSSLPAKSATVKKDEGVLSWGISIDPNFKLLGQGRVFNIPLPDGNILKASVQKRDVLNNGDVQIQADIYGGGAAIFTIGVGVTFASISHQSSRFSIGMDNDGRPAMFDQLSFPDDDANLGDDMMMPADFLHQRLNMLTNQSRANQTRNLSTPSTVESEVSNIDVLVVYSSEFADVFSSPETRINQLIAFSNASFTNSGILINLRLAAAVEVGFDNNDSVSENLSNATNGTGSFTNLAALRNQHGADLVSVLNVNLENQFSANGIAWLNATNQRLAFSATRISANCCDSVFTHEIGHNLGSGHEYTIVNPNLPTSNQCGGGITGFSCGHGNFANSWGTIMTNYGISAKAAVNFVFSNLDVECVGSACGVAQGNANAADNRSSFNLTRLLVADFRDEVVVVTPVEPSPSIPNNTELGWNKAQY